MSPVSDALVIQALNDFSTSLNSLREKTINLHRQNGGVDYLIQNGMRKDGDHMYQPYAFCFRLMSDLNCSTFEEVDTLLQQRLRGRNEDISDAVTSFHQSEVEWNRYLETLDAEIPRHPQSSVDPQALRVIDAETDTEMTWKEMCASHGKRWTWAVFMRKFA